MLKTFEPGFPRPKPFQHSDERFEALEANFNEELKKLKERIHKLETAKEYA